MFIPSRRDNNKRQKPSRKSRTVDVLLHVNFKGGVVPRVHVNVNDPSRIQVNVVGGANYNQSEDIGTDASSSGS
jgi:hypothetical protein